MSKLKTPPPNLGLPESAELRFAAGSIQMEYREAEGSKTPEAFVGKAITCGVRSKNLGGFVEVIDKDALNDADITDVKGLFNHNSDNLLGTTGAGTLTLTRDSDGGLSYRIAYDPTDPDHTRVMAKIVRGDVVGSSFAFTVAAGGADWDDEESEAGTLYVRTVKKVKRIFDVSPVTDPAYADSTAAKRSLGLHKQEHTPPAAQVPLSVRQKQLSLLSR